MTQWRRRWQRWLQQRLHPAPSVSSTSGQPRSPPARPSKRVRDIGPCAHARLNHRDIEPPMLNSAPCWRLHRSSVSRDDKSRSPKNLFQINKHVFLQLSESISNRGRAGPERSEEEVERKPSDGSGGGGGGDQKTEAWAASGFTLEINYSCRRRTNEFTTQGGLDESPGRGPRMSSKNGPFPRGCG